MSDLFPRLEEKHVDHGVLETQIRAAIARMGLEEVDGMLNISFRSVCTLFQRSKLSKILFFVSLRFVSLNSINRYYYTFRRSRNSI